MTKTRRTQKTEPKVYDARRRVQSTPAAHGDYVLELLTEELQRTVERGQEYANKLARGLSADPIRALEWSREAFNYAGRQRVASTVLYALEARTTRGDEYDAPSTINVLRGVRETLFGNVLRGARSPASSTSGQSNLAEQAVLSASAELLETVDRYLMWGVR